MDTQENTTTQEQTAGFEKTMELISSTKNKVNAMKILEKELKGLNALEKKVIAKKERIEKLTQQLL